MRDGYLYGKEPNSFIKASYNNFKKSQQVLCLGEGEGRNAVFLACEGFDVSAIDASDVGLKKLEELASHNGVEIKTRCMDLNEWVPSKAYGSIVFSYLHMYGNEKGTLLKKNRFMFKTTRVFCSRGFLKKPIELSKWWPKR